MAPRLREVIASIPEVRGVMSHVGRPDDGTDVTSFFNLEFNVPLRPMEEWRSRSRSSSWACKLWDRTITREEIQDELMEKFERVPRRQLQLLAADPRQRRGGALGRQGGELGQALRHRPEARWRRPGSGSSNILQDGPRDRERRPLPHRRPAEPGDPDRPPGRAPATGSTSPTSRRSSRWPSAARRSRRWSRGRSSTTSSCGCPSTSATTRTSSRRIPVDAPGAGRQAGRPDPALAARHDQPAQAGGLVHLPREQPAVHPDQVQRPRTATSPRRSPRRSRRSSDPKTGAELPDGLRHRVVGRVRPDAGGQRPADAGSSRSRSA